MTLEEAVAAYESAAAGATKANQRADAAERLLRLMRERAEGAERAVTDLRRSYGEVAGRNLAFASRTAAAETELLTASERLDRCGIPREVEGRTLSTSSRVRLLQERLIAVALTAAGTGEPEAQIG